jgi:hypothetical protein
MRPRARPHRDRSPIFVVGGAGTRRSHGIAALQQQASLPCLMALFHCEDASMTLI